MDNNENPWKIRPLAWKPEAWDLPAGTPRPVGWAMIAQKGGVDFEWAYHPVFESCPEDVNGEQHVVTICADVTGTDAHGTRYETCMESWGQDWVYLGYTGDELVS